MSNADHPAVSVVIPTYRAGDSLEVLLNQLVDVFADEQTTVEFIVIDDRSPDDTWLRLLAIAERIPQLRAIRLQKNAGQMTATLCGIAEASGDVIVTMDDDLQNPPEEIPKLLDALESAPEWDVVIGSWDRGNDGRFRSVGSWGFERLQNLAVPQGNNLRHTAFRAFRRPVGEAMVEHGTRHPVMTSMIFEVADSVHNVDVQHAPRASGDSNFRFRAAAKLTLDNFVQTSALPLYWITGFGFFVAFVALVVGIVYVIRALAGAETPPGWTSTFLAVMFFGGTTLATLGLLGRYMAVIMNEVRRPPRWVVRERIR
ncbi:MAG: glycosyltransferase family 2 protein [Actinomycetia bacterium]|nr:glycosyltransferase family 2 protein [Actinomycetes bacterium]